MSLLNIPLIQGLFFIVLDGNFAPRKSKRFPMKILVWFRVCHKHFCHYYDLHNVKWKVIGCWKMVSLQDLLPTVLAEAKVPGPCVHRGMFSYNYKKMRKVLFEEIWLFHLSWVIASGMQFTRVVERQVVMAKCMQLTRAAMWLSFQISTVLLGYSLRLRITEPVYPLIWDHNYVL